jgi:AFG3 family protein
VDILDSALTRPGRFDRQIQVDKPDISGRKAIFEVHLKGITLDGQASDFSSRLAALTPGFSGADIANICNEAAIIAARRNKKKVDIKDFESATDRVIGGLETKRVMSIEERRVVGEYCQTKCQTYHSYECSASAFFGFELLLCASILSEPT